MTVKNNYTTFFSTWCEDMENGLSQIHFTWKFDFASEDIEKFVGTIDVKFRQYQFQNYVTVQRAVTLTDRFKWATVIVENPTRREHVEVMFEYSLTPWLRPLPFSRDEIFLPSEKNDAVLVIGERKLHVNKDVCY